MQIDLGKAKELFLAVLDLPAAERAAHLDSACGGDTALRQRVEAMLQTHENSGELLSRSPAAMLQDANATDVSGTAAFVPSSGSPTLLPEHEHTDDDSLSFLTPSDAPGSLGRLGHYEVRQIIGKGGFGIVFKAFDEHLHRVVAIKVLAPAYAASGSARKRFIREARAAAAVKNDHVVGIHEVQGEGQPPYLVMEYVGGISLQDKLDKCGSLSLKEILRIGMQIAEGLAAAHNQGVVHRDIKPANILLENGVERVKITDFGLARSVDDASVTQSGTVAGTPMYMSPEQAEGLPVDHRSDLFSLGTVLYAMCTGHPPFRASGTHAVLKRVIDGTSRPIREINDDIPEWLEAIVVELHAKKPEERLQTAAEVAELLRSHLANVQQPGLGTPPRVATGRGRTARGVPQRSGWRRRLALAAIAGLLLATALLAARFIAVLRTGGPLETVMLPDKGLPPERLAWTPLFNEKNLDGWSVIGGSPSTWSVDNGILRATGKASYLVSDRRYVNFHLKGEVRISPGGELGVLFRTDRIARQADTRTLYGLGALFTHRGPTNDVLGQIQMRVEPLRDGQPLALVDKNIQPHDWLPLDVLVQDDSIRIELGGAMAGASALVTAPMAGPIVLRLANDKCVLEFRKLEIRNLGLLPPPPSAVAPFDAGKAKAYQEAWATYLGVDVAMSNSIGMKLLLLPPGEFTMGSTATQIDAVKKRMQASGVAPVREEWNRIIDAEAQGSPVRLSNPFRLSQHEVTVAQFRRFVEERDYQTEAERDGKGTVVSATTGAYESAPGTSWRKPGPYEAHDEHPVVQVSWNDALEFCRWLSNKEGRRYRLPTDAEWEYACRAGTSGLYSSGDDAFEHGQRVVGSQKTPAPVGTKKANAFGLYDMEGNAWEWCADWSAANDGSARVDPTGPAQGTHRIFRGGSYLNPPWVCRPAIRLSDLPSARTCDTGFRVVVEVE